MGVLMTRRKAEALRSIERDRHLLSDKAAQERYEEATQGEKRLTKAEQRAWDEFRQKIGR